MMTHSELGSKFGPRLREARMNAGLSENDLGAKVYATERSIRGYENGIIIPNLIMVCNLAKVLKVPVGWLLAGEEATQPKPMQKPLTLTEANSYQDPVWIEFKVFKEASGWRDGLCDALNWAHCVYRDLNREAEFMVHYRLWRHRPTDEERSAAAWES